MAAWELFLASNLQAGLLTGEMDLIDLLVQLATAYPDAGN
jgi:hypothetical protein